MRTALFRNSLDRYMRHLSECELAASTQRKYRRVLLAFFSDLPAAGDVDKEHVVAYKRKLEKKYKTASVNSYLISVNKFLVWMGRPDLTLRTVRMQRAQALDNVLNEEEYHRLLNYCKRNCQWRNYLLLKTVAGTGIRIGELGFITSDAVQRGVAQVVKKGKCRNVYLCPDLCKLLQGYVEKNHIAGIIFHGKRRDCALHPSSVWKLLKELAKNAAVAPGKVYPHNLRHLFAKTYMKKIGNIFELADLLGHSSLETTRIYTLTSGQEKRNSLAALAL